MLPVINGFIALALVFIACELGQRMNDAFEGIGFTIEQFNWYLLPIGIKKMLPMIHLIGQQPVSLECFESITCTRYVFKDVGIGQFNIRIEITVISVFRLFIVHTRIS